jgi:predicted Fe-S protein YdhL (DUF1289 family)
MGVKRWSWSWRIRAPGRSKGTGGRTGCGGGTISRVMPPAKRTFESPCAHGSPCVRSCCLDEADVCMGCGRSLQEILQWHAASPEEREAIKAAAKLRMDERRARQRW